MSLKIKVDFTNVKESSGINPKRMPAGDYKAVITDITKRESNAGNQMLEVIFQLSNHRSASYPYYVVLDEKSLWKLRNILLAVGAKVPKGAANIDVARLKGKEVGISLEDDEYEGRDKSTIDAVFEASEIDDDGGGVEAEEEDDEETTGDIDDLDEDDLDEIDL